MVVHVFLRVCAYVCMCACVCVDARCILRIEGLVMVVSGFFCVYVCACVHVCMRVCVMYLPF